LPTCMRHLLLDMYVPTAKSAKNDHSLVKTIITNHVCIIQVATIYSAIFDMVIIYTLQICRKFIIFLLCSQEENYFFHPWCSTKLSVTPHPFNQLRCDMARVRIELHQMFWDYQIVLLFLSRPILCISVFVVWLIWRIKIQK
jgi:hypothetical protein